jgi:hypothetical protein
VGEYAGDLAKDYGAPELGVVADTIISRSSLVAGDRTAVLAVLDVATEGSPYRAAQLQQPFNRDQLLRMQAAAAACNTSKAADIVVEIVTRDIHQTMFPPPPAKADQPTGEPYLKAWWHQHVRR